MKLYACYSTYLEMKNPRGFFDDDPLFSKTMSFKFVCHCNETINNMDIVTVRTLEAPCIILFIAETSNGTKYHRRCYMFMIASLRIR